MENQKEIWKDIEGYESLYQASNNGKIKSLNRIRRHWRGGKSKLSGCELKPFVNHFGYKQIVLSKNGKTKSLFVHRLIAETFLKVDDNLQVNHIDGDKLNNNLFNLEIVTAKENMLHAYKIGLRDKGSKHHFSKLTKANVLLIRKHYAQGKITYEQLANKFCVSRGCISGIITRASWKHI